MNTKNRNYLRILFSGLVGLILAITSFGQVSIDNGLDGTYALDRNQSDSVQAATEAAVRNDRLSAQQRDELETQLTPPVSITIKTDVRNKNLVTLSTSNTAETTFEVNGASQTVRGADGQQYTVTATMRNGALRMSRVGNGSSYSITFAQDNSSGLRVTRMITTQYLSQTVYADSYYVRAGTYSGTDPDDDVPFTGDSDDYPDDDSNGVYSSSDPGDNSGGNYPSTRSNTSGGRFVVPKGVVIEGTLENVVTTKSSQDNDQFRLTVQSPSEYRGAVIEGYLSDVKRTGRITGRARLTFNFETITLRNGQTYNFAGVLQTITDGTGKVIDVSDEGEAKTGSKTKESVKRGGIGAGVGAILGGIIGGAKGAIIGATIGGGAGAGSVMAQGKDDIELREGSTLTIESTSPDNTR